LVTGIRHGSEKDPKRRSEKNIVVFSIMPVSGPARLSNLNATELTAAVTVVSQFSVELREQPLLHTQVII
jgi:hypothetical protein